jgi:YD repeat-containing protein
MSTHTYDALNRIDTVTDLSQGITRYKYDVVGNVMGIRLPNGVTTTRQWDALKCLKELTHAGATGEIASYTYTLDAVGNRIAVEENTGRMVPTRTMTCIVKA